MENRGTSASSTIRTTFDQAHNVSGWAWLRRDSDKNNRPQGPLITGQQHSSFPPQRRVLVQRQDYPVAERLSQRDIQDVLQCPEHGFDSNLHLGKLS